VLTINVPGIEVYDESTNEFKTEDGFDLDLEHSLVSLSKWESITAKPFLSSERKTSEEVLLYIQTMTLNQEIPPGLFLRMTQDNLDQIDIYIERKMTATWFNELPSPPPLHNQIITSELIYYWMIAFNIPVEFERWHLNRLFTLIKICNVKNEKPKKMSRSESLARNRSLNAQRRAELNSNG
jgi:hypothetical protein